MPRHRCGDGAGVLTPRLEVRPPREADRARFVELFCDEAFMVFSDGAHDAESAARLHPDARGRGYATEAASAVLELAAQTYRGELLVIIHPTNVASITTSEKLGFTFWKQATVDGQVRYVGRRQLG